MNHSKWINAGTVLKMNALNYPGKTGWQDKNKSFGFKEWNKRACCFANGLKSMGIGTGIHYPITLPNLKAYEHLGHARSDFPESTRASEEILSLPMFPELTKEQIAHVRDSVHDFFR